MTPSPIPALDLATTLRAVEGEPEALARLCAHYHPVVVGLSRRLIQCCCPTENEQELAQEVWCHLLARGGVRLRSYDPARGTFGAFLRLVARRQARAIATGWVERERRAHEIAGLVALVQRCHPSPIRVIERRELLRHMLDAVAPLDELDRTLLAEVLVEQRSVCEVAPRLERSLSVLHKRHQRLRARLIDAARRLDPAPTRHAA